MRKNNKHNKTKKNHSNYKKTDILIKYLLQLQLQIKFNHWNTYCYKTHKVTDKFGVKLSEHIDMLIEVLIGKGYKLYNIANYYNDIGDIKNNTSLYNILNIIVKNIENIICPNDVKTILDNIVIDIHRFHYLMSMS